VRDRGVLRKLITVSDEISGQAFSPQGKEVKQMLDEAESKIFAIAEEGARGSQGFQQIQPLLTQVVERIDELYNRDSNSDITGVPTVDTLVAQHLLKTVTALRRAPSSSQALALLLMSPEFQRR